MKTAVVVHGWDGSPNEPMLQWIKAELEKKGFSVQAPEMPNPGEPKIEEWVGKLKEVMKVDSESIVVGHSVGCQGVLRYLETLEAGEKIDRLILIAPWMALDMNTINEEGEEVVETARPWMETPIDFGKVRSHVNKTIAIFSDNDPYVPLEQKDLFEKELDAEIVIEHNKGHFIASTVTELPVIDNYIE